MMKMRLSMLALMSLAVLSAISSRSAVGGDFGTVETVVFDGNAGWEHDGVTYRLACAVNIVEAGNGDLLVTWLSGSDKEPAPDNCVLMARSKDGGQSWSEPWVFIPAGKNAAHVTNLYRANDGTLVALGAHWPAEDEYTTWYYFRMTSKDHGETWSDPEPFTLLNNRASLGRRILLDDGTWLFPGTCFEKRDTPLHGGIEAIAAVADETQARELAQRFDEPNTNKFSRFIHGCIAFNTADDLAVELNPSERIDNRPLGMIEPSVVQLSDGTVVMLMRAEWGGFLWASRSGDRGRRWTPAEPTDIPNPSSMAQLLRLRDGRIALFHNPTGGKVGHRGPRDPLEMWISDDEMRTWGDKSVIASGGRCAYPHAIETTGGQVLVAYDRDRRGVRLIRIELKPGQPGYPKNQ
jgi:hypothetical protein